MPDFTIYGYGDKFSGDDILFQEQKRSDSKAIYQCLLKKPLVSYKSVDAFIAAPPAAIHCQAIHILELSRNKKYNTGIALSEEVNIVCTLPCS